MSAGVSTRKLQNLLNKTGLKVIQSAEIQREDFYVGSPDKSYLPPAFVSMVVRAENIQRVKQKQVVAESTAVNGVAIPVPKRK